MSVIAREPVTSQVHRHLRDRILRGEISEGARLVETDLAAEMGVSRTPVRQALALLRGQDLVEPLEHGGYRVCDVRGELMDILDIRIALETHAVRRSAKSMDEATLRSLDDICDRMEALPGESVSERADLNRQFHATLIGNGRNRRLERIVNEYQEYFLAVQMLFDDGNTERTEKEHRAIIAALRRSDVDKAVSLIAKHIEYAGEQARRWSEPGRKSDKEGAAA